jgi:arsenate reductase-like glutaredoxin family protein
MIMMIYCQKEKKCLENGFTENLICSTCTSIKEVLERNNLKEEGFKIKTKKRDNQQLSRMLQEGKENEGR